MRGISALALCALWAAVGLGAPGCAPSTARLTVRVQSGLRAGDELRHVRAFVFRGGSCVDAVEIGAGALPLERDEQSALGAGTLTVAEVGPLEPGVYAVQLVGRRPGATGAESGAVLLERCVVTSISNDRVLRIALTTACVGVTCPAAGGSEAFTECLNGQCVDPRCDPTRPETEAFCCDRDRLGDACDADPSVCRDDDDCDVIADCVGAPRCSEGACIEAEDDRCDEAGQHCDVAMRACVPDAPRVDADAGLLDARAETLDAGVDELDAPLDMDAASAPLDAEIAGDAAADRDAGTDVGRPDAARPRTDAAPTGPCAGEPATTVCRAAAGPCDVAERCDGVSASCPPDAFAASTVTCRAASGVCDAAETCTGTSATCPMDLAAPGGMPCSGADSYCDGSGACCVLTCEGLGGSCPPICGSCGGDFNCTCTCCGGSVQVDCT